MVKRVEESPMPAESTFGENYWGSSFSVILHIVDTWAERPLATSRRKGHILYVREGTEKGFYHCYGTESVYGGGTPQYLWTVWLSSAGPLLLAEGTSGTRNSTARADHIHPVGWYS
jgi:hypothetical protein